MRGIRIFGRGCSSRGLSTKGFSKRGFVLTLDAAIAVVIALLMITGATFYLSQNSHLNLEDTGFITAMDSLAMLEKNGGLGDYVSTGSTAEITGLWGGLPYDSCTRLTFYQVGDGGSIEKLSSFGREGCGYPVNYAIARRVFISGGDIYLAELVGWRR
jgi:hypothetical protein